MNNLTFPGHIDEIPKRKEDLVQEHLEATRAKIATNQIVTFRAVNGKQQGQLILHPAKDGLTGQMKGVAVMSPEEMQKAKRVVTFETSRKITEGLQLNLNNEIDKVDLEWILLCDEIALSFYEAQQSRLALYYVEDVDRDLKERIDTRRNKYKALDLIFNATPEQRNEVTRLLGQPTYHWTESQTLDFLTDRVETNPLGPAEVIDKFTNKNRKATLFFLGLQDKKIIRKAGGMWYYGEIPLGSQDNQVIAFLQNNANADIIGELYHIMNPPAAVKDYRGDNVLEELEKRRVVPPAAFQDNSTVGKRQNPFAQQDKANVQQFQTDNPGVPSTVQVQDTDTMDQDFQDDADMPPIEETLGTPVPPADLTSGGTVPQPKNASGQFVKRQPPRPKPKENNDI